MDPQSFMSRSTAVPAVLTKEAGGTPASLHKSVDDVSSLPTPDKFALKNINKNKQQKSSVTAA